MRDRKIFILLFLLTFIVIFSTVMIGLGGTRRGILKDVSPDEAYELLQKWNESPDFVILDVRTPGEYNEGHIEDALNIDFYNDGFKSDLRKLERDKAYLIYCRSGNRSGRTLDMMQQLGFKEVYNIEGGMTKWLHRNYPVVQ
jgi:rhodanese-related sulfurtransferase